MKKSLKLSPSALNLFKDCPRCFWREKNNNIKRPRGIFPSLPGGMDRVIKTYFDGYRTKKTLPPELNRDEFKDILLFNDQVLLERWRNWRTGLVYQDGPSGGSLSGALDDLMMKGDRYIPFDYKTKGSMTTEADAVKYYQLQLDCYALMIESNQMPAIGYGFLLYFSPAEVCEAGQVKFNVQPIRIETKTERAIQTLRAALELLDQPAPPAAPACEYCNWLQNFKRPR